MIPEALRSVVFDLDGTLVDSAPDIRRVANSVLAEEGRAPVTLEETRGFIGSGAPVLVRRMAAARDLPQEGPGYDALLARFLARYEGAVEQTRLYPGVADALARLQAMGLRLGLCTNKPQGPTSGVLAHFGLTRVFGAVVGGDTLPVRKPDPAPLLHVVEALGGGPTLYVGDSEVDAQAAAAALIPFALYTEGYRKGPVAGIPHAFAFDHWDLLAQRLAPRRHSA